MNIVLDKYYAFNSVKAGERKRRRNITGNITRDVLVNSVKQVLPRNIKTFLANLKNKDNFTFSEWENTMPGKYHATKDWRITSFSASGRVSKITRK